MSKAINETISTITGEFERNIKPPKKTKAIVFDGKNGRDIVAFFEKYSKDLDYSVVAKNGGNWIKMTCTLDDGEVINYDTITKGQVVAFYFDHFHIFDDLDHFYEFHSKPVKRK